MKMPVLLTAALSALVAPSLAVAKPAPSAPPSMCAPAEEVVFDCAQGRKVISLCAAQAPNGQGRTQLRYVSGTPGKIELDIAQAAHPEAFTAGETGLSGGGIDYVRVKNGDFAYVVYTGMTPGWSQDGWIVESKGNAISHHICKGGATGPDVWGPVYKAKLKTASDDQSFQPPEWVGAAPKPAH